MLVLVLVLVLVLTSVLVQPDTTATQQNISALHGIHSTEQRVQDAFERAVESDSLIATMTRLRRKARPGASSLSN